MGFKKIQNEDKGLYDDQDTLKFYTVFPEYSELMKKRVPNEESSKIKTLLKNHVVSVINIQEESMINELVKEFLIHLRVFVLEKLKLSVFVTEIIKQLKKKDQISFIARYFYIIQLHVKEDISVYILNLVSSTTLFKTLNICFILLSEFFKFTNNKNSLMEAFTLLFNSIII